MAVTFESLKKRANQLFAEVGRDARKLAPGTLYYTLCAAALLPVAEAAAKGEGRPEVLIPLAMSIAGDVGKNLLANVMEKSAAESSRDEVVEFVKEEIAKGGATAINECDALLTRLDAIIQTQKSVSEENKAWFAAEIKKQFMDVKSHIQIEVNERGVIVMGGNSGIINTGTIVQFYLAGGGKETRTDANWDEAIKKYWRWLQVDCGEIAMRCEGETRQADPLEISRAFIHLDLQKRGFFDEQDFVFAHKSRTRGEDEDKRQNVISTRDVLKHGKKIILTGGPGCGKSTVLQALAWVFSTALLNDSYQAVSSLFSLPKDGTSEVVIPMPILIPLARYADFVAKLDAKDDHSLAAYISHYLREKQVAFDLPDDFFAALMKKNAPIILLLDGLDEVVEIDTRAEIAHAIDDLAKSRENLRMVVTCRSAAYIGRATLSANRFEHLVVLPLNNAQTQAMVQQAYGDIFADRPADRDDSIRRLLGGIRELEEQRRQRMGNAYEPFVDSPLIVRMLLIVDYNDRKLPNQRALLYERVIANMISPDFHRDDHVITLLNRQIGERHIELMRVVAFAMHSAGEKQGKFIAKDQLKRALKDARSFDDDAIDAFIRLINRRDTLLSERGGVYRFIHLSFQEHLAAQYIRLVKGDEGGLKSIASYLHQADASGTPPVLQSWWREPILLIVGQFGEAERAENFLRELARVSPDAATLHLACLEIAATAWQEIPRGREAARKEIADKLASAFRDVNVISRAKPAVLRAAAGRALARLGDPREEVMKVEAMKFCFVPAGPFDMGSDNTDELALSRENPLRENVEVPAFWISQHPISNAQFAQFVKAGGYNKPEYWVEAKAVGYRFDGPHDYGEPYSLPNHPAVGITWFEALAFTRWLTETQTLRGRGLMAALPSETEWEKAARGGHARMRQPKVEDIGGIASGMPLGVEMLIEPAPNRRIYPWGNDKPDDTRANFDGAGINSTSALGCFPLGASPYGCQDMSGNVWEWCFTKWQDNYEHYREDEAFNKEVFKDDRRVVRGGSYFFNLRGVRCAYRDRSAVDNFYDVIGFRIVLRSHLPLISDALNSEPLNT